MKTSRTTLVLLTLACATHATAGDGPAPSSTNSLVRNGDYEEADPAAVSSPAGWQRSDGLGVKWLTATGDGARHGKIIAMDTSVSEKAMVAQWKKSGITEWDIPNPTDGPVAATYGLSLYSDAIPALSGRAYRVSFDFKGPSGGAKVWVRGYGDFEGRLRRRYETIVNCRAATREWTHFSQVFHPTRMRPEVKELKIMLYAYWPPGVYAFDNVALELADDAPPTAVTAEPTPPQPPAGPER